MEKGRLSAKLNEFDHDGSALHRRMVCFDAYSIVDSAEV